MKICGNNLEKFLRFNKYCDIDSLDLFSELKVLSYIKTLDSFPNIYIAYRMLLTIPIPGATVERSFSKLKLFRSYLRSTMLQDRFNVLAILSIESEMLELFDHKILINNFVVKKLKN